VMFTVALVYFISAVFKLSTFIYCLEQWFVIISDVNDVVSLDSPSCEF
jgi:hypothetical protein